MPKLEVVITSTREGRACPSIARWFVERAEQHGKFEVELVDLLEVDLPMLEEPEHPRKQNYHYAPTKRWAAIVDSADAFVFVTPEYNFGMPPALLNALDYLYVEWNYKAAGFVSYGGVSGGSRSVEMSKQVLTTLKVVPIPEAVTIPFFSKYMGEGANFDPGEVQAQAANTMLDELLRWTEALTTLRKRD